MSQKPFQVAPLVHKGDVAYIRAGSFPDDATSFRGLPGLLPGAIWSSFESDGWDRSTIDHVFGTVNR